MSILEKIIKFKRNELRHQRSIKSYGDLEKLENFNRKTNSLKNNLIKSSFGIITEFKRKSPSKPKINLEAKVNRIIRDYENEGANALSILTDQKFFGGNINDIIESREITNLPILRKEFIIDEFQVVESKAIGADAILLIAACLDEKSIRNLSICAKSIGLDVLVEVNDKLIPNEYAKISESGISNSSEILLLKDYGFDGFLIGEKFMSKSNPGNELSKMMKDLNK